MAFPWDIRKEFGKGRVKVHATFDGVPYDGSVVNMGVVLPDVGLCAVAKKSVYLLAFFALHF